MKKIRIGSGAGYAGDRLEPAITLLDKGQLDYIAFECLAERTIAIAQGYKRTDPAKGYNHLLEYRMRQVLPKAHMNKVKVITNMGAANPEAALDVICHLAREMEVSGLKVAAVVGDDVLDRIRGHKNLRILENGEPLESIADKMVSANAYFGAGPIVEALEQGADVIVTGRVADPSLFLAPMIYEFGWTLNDFTKLGKGTLIGHLLECGGQVSGGYFADPGVKEVPDLGNLGFPLVEVSASANGFISKVPGTGGVINCATCTEQLLYEIHDPSNYITPDCIADFSNVEFEQLEKDKIEFKGAEGRPSTDTYKVSVGYRNGFSGEGEISYGGINCVQRAQLAIQILQDRLERYELSDLRFELIGLNAISPLQFNHVIKDTPEVRLRVAGRAKSLEIASKIGLEVEALYTNGPAGGGGATQKSHEQISIASVLLPKVEVNSRIIFKSVD